MDRFLYEWQKQKERIASVLGVLTRTSPRTLSRMANKRICDEKFVGRTIGARFDTQGMSGGAPWPSLKADTVRERAKEGFAPAPILVRTGTLKKASMKGRDKPDTTGITHNFQDGPGPAYGKRKATRLSVYAQALNRTRPFLQDVVLPEAKAIINRYMEIVKNFYSNALDGKLQ